MNTSSHHLPEVGGNWHVYIVECSDGSLYTGVTLDVEKRVLCHNAGKGAKYTRSRIPVSLVYAESVGDKGNALKREHTIKQMTTKAKRALIEPPTK
jgi:putative endonuclease